MEIVNGNTVWRFETEFLTSNWTCLYGRGCKGILDHDATELGQGCCSLGAHFGDGPAGEAEAMTVSAYASMLEPERFQYHDVARLGRDDRRGDRRQRDLRGRGADPHPCRRRRVHLPQPPGFAGGAGCALHLAALDAGDSPTEWKPSVCWQLPLGVDWQEIDDTQNRRPCADGRERDWGDHGRTMAWCCTERNDGGEAYSGDTAVVESLRDELIALAGEPVYVELRRRLA